MGAWGSTVFSNDYAADFVSEFDGLGTIGDVVPLIDSALDSALGATGYPESPEGSVALAAAALVVSWHEPGTLGADASYAPEPWPSSAGSLPGYLKPKAAAVLDRMRDLPGNELAELWDEAGLLSEYTAEIDRWRSRIA